MSFLLVFGQLWAAMEQLLVTHALKIEESFCYLFLWTMLRWRIHLLARGLLLLPSLLQHGHYVLLFLTVLLSILVVFEKPSRLAPERTLLHTSCRWVESRRFRSDPHISSITAHVTVLVYFLEGLGRAHKRLTPCFLEWLESACGGTTYSILCGTRCARLPAFAESGID